MNEEFAEDRRAALEIVLDDYEAMTKTLQENFKRDTSKYLGQRVRIKIGRYKGYFATIKRIDLHMWNTTFELDILRKDNKGIIKDWNSRFVRFGEIEFF